MTKSLLWDDEYLLSLINSMDMSQFTFWNWSQYGNLHINKYELLRRFLPSIGFFNLPMDVDKKGCPTFAPVFIRGNRMQEVNGGTIQAIVERFLELWDDVTESNLGDQIVSALGFSADVFEKKGLATLPKKNGIDVLKDTATKAYVFFRNGLIEVTANSVSSLKDYSEIPSDKFIWEDRVIPNDWVTTTPVHTHFHDFISNLARGDDGEICDHNLTRIKLSLGFLSHRYHFADKRKWVIVVDRHIDPNHSAANGGNGKSILIKSLQSFLNYAEIDGGEFRESDRFAFSNVSASTDIVYFDDANKNLNLKRLYTKCSGSFEVAVKYKNTFTIPAADAPKIALTTNYPLVNDEYSTVRRTFQVEVSDFYKTKSEQYGLSPADHHGGKLIADVNGGWSNDDWGHFYQVICESISLYLKKGLPAQAEESITFKRNRLCADMPVDNKEEMLDYLHNLLLDASQTGDEVFAEHFYKQTRKKFAVSSFEVSNRDLWELLKKVGNAFRLLPNHAQNGHLQQARLNVEARKERWIAAGMEDYRDDNGNNPMDDYKYRVLVFTVTSFQSIEDAFKSSKPNFNQSHDEMTDI